MIGESRGQAFRVGVDDPRQVVQGGAWPLAMGGGKLPGKIVARLLSDHSYGPRVCPRCGGQVSVEYQGVAPALYTYSCVDVFVVSLYSSTFIEQHEQPVTQCI